MQLHRDRNGQANLFWFNSKIKSTSMRERKSLRHKPSGGPLTYGNEDWSWSLGVVWGGILWAVAIGYPALIRRE